MKREEARPGDGDARQPDATGRRSDQLSRLNAADKVVAAYLAVIALLILTFSYRIESWGWLCAGHAVAIVVVVLMAKLDRPVAPSPPRSVASFIHGWYPVALMFVTYKELSFLIPRIHAHDFDATLAALDLRLFGVNPSVWLERLTWPPLTEVLQLTYSSYYFLPVILGAVLWSRGRFDEFRFWVFVVVLGFYLSYLGYIAVPAIGPRFQASIVTAQTKPLTGVLFFNTIRSALDRVEGITRDCFPSGHTELTLLVLYYAHKLHRKTYWWLLPFGIGIIISTVYLRYHYVVDVFAGALLAVTVVLIAQPLYGLLGGKSAQRGV